MHAYNKLLKPQNVRHAEVALWVWTAWTCLFGLYQSWGDIPEMEQAINDQLQGAITADPHTLLEWIVAAYVGIAVTSAWVTIKIGAGQHWARSSLVWGFILEFIFVAWPPHHWMKDIAAAIPDLGLQIYALYMLYTKPGSDWFETA